MANIFHACDIRGIAGTDLTLDKARQIGLAVGTKLMGKKVVVGGDVRLSTPELQSTMVAALAESGCDVFNIGTVASPAFYYALQELEADGGVMVTASHNPAPYNGFKLVLGPGPVTEEEVAEIRAIVENGEFSSGFGCQREYPLLADYIDHTVRKAAPAQEPLRVVVDAGNGAAALTAPRVLQSLGYEVIPLFCEPDGNFPNRAPNPALSENLTALAAKVVETGAALGIAFDGDGDRLGVVDETGRVISNDKIMVLLARYYLAAKQGRIIYDAKCSMVVPEEIKKAGGEPIMGRAGHTFIKQAFLEQQALFGGELSGHFFFQELGYDDGLFAGLKVCELIAANGKLSLQADSVPDYLLTPDIRVTYHGSDKAEVIDEIAEKLQAYQPNRIDGVRIEFNDGWAMIRSSVTEPLFTLRFEAKTQSRLREIAQILLAALPGEVRESVQAKLTEVEGF
ncbi:MAG: phosphomannomutase/phosphoglucomutase [Sporomusaceae bacterium]|nr:phosphomannomutase/phosphoglucomutase [Sporomusaceae bacterium]